jgi:hypothetical protein
MIYDDGIEFYNVDGTPGRDLIATVKSPMVPPTGAKISIRKRTWEVVSVTYALDDSDDRSMAKMRANVDLRAC